MVDVSWSRSYVVVVVVKVSDVAVETYSNENSSRIENITFMTGSVVWSITAVGEVVVVDVGGDDVVVVGGGGAVVDVGGDDVVVVGGGGGNAVVDDVVVVGVSSVSELNSKIGTLTFFCRLLWLFCRAGWANEIVPVFPVNWGELLATPTWKILL